MEQHRGAPLSGPTRSTLFRLPPTFESESLDFKAQSSAGEVDLKDGLLGKPAVSYVLGVVDNRLSRHSTSHADPTLPATYVHIPHSISTFHVTFSTGLISRAIPMYV